MINNGDDWKNRPRKYGLTTEDRQKLVERHFERAELRQIEADLNLLRTLELARALQKVKEG